MLPRSKYKSILLVCCLSFTAFACTNSFSQSKSSQRSASKSAQQADNGIRLANPVEQIWEFGAKVNSSGRSSRIVFQGPVPMAWPEQEVEVIEEIKSDNVGRFSFKDVDNHAKQLSFGINRVGAGQSVEAFVKVKVKKRMIEAPSDTSQFLIPKKVPSKIKTYLKPSPHIQSKDKRIKELAKTIGAGAQTDWEKVEAVYQWVRENVEYKFDVVNRSCLHALENKYGDCGELSALFIAICRAKGVPARAVWIPGHTYPEFYLHDKDGGGHWFPCQAAGSYQFGSMAEARPILQKGDRFRIKGSREEVAYLRPTLGASEGNGLGMEWIARPSGKKQK